MGGFFLPRWSQSVIIGAVAGEDIATMAMGKLDVKVDTVDRVSKMHKHTNACRRKIFCDLRQTLTLEHKTDKKGTFFIFLLFIWKIIIIIY